MNEIRETIKGNLLGTAEVSKLLDVSRQRVHEIVMNPMHNFPEPIAELQGGRIWLRDDVETWRVEWKRKIGRPTLSDSHTKTREYVQQIADCGPQDAKHTPCEECSTRPANMQACWSSRGSRPSRHLVCAECVVRQVASVRLRKYNERHVWIFGRWQLEVLPLSNASKESQILSERCLVP